MTNIRRSGSRVIVVWLLLFCAVLPFQDVQASYNTAIILQKDPPLRDGSVRLIVRFTGNAGEEVRDRDFLVEGGTTLTDFRRWAIREAALLETRRTLAASLVVGQPVDLTPISPVVLTPEEIWRRDYARYLRIKVGVDAGLIPAGDTAVIALRDSVINGWVRGYVATF